MLSIVFLYFIGKFFYTLTQKYNKNKWLYAILGIVAYYVGSGVGGLVIAVADDLFNFGFDWDNQFTLIIVALVFGGCFATIFYFILKRQWNKSYVEPINEIEAIGSDSDQT